MLFREAILAHINVVQTPPQRKQNLSQLQGTNG